MSRTEHPAQVLYNTFGKVLCLGEVGRIPNGRWQRNGRHPSTDTPNLVSRAPLHKNRNVLTYHRTTPGSSHPVPSAVQNARYLLRYGEVRYCTCPVKVEISQSRPSPPSTLSRFRRRPSQCSWSYLVPQSVQSQPRPDREKKKCAESMQHHRCFTVVRQQKRPLHHWTTRAVELANGQYASPRRITSY